MTGALAIAFFAHAAQAMEIDVEVDARDTHRHLLSTTAEYPVSGDRMVLRYPQWIPGIHGPRAALENLAEVIITTPEGEEVEWQREPGDAYRFIAHVPQGADSILVTTTYIANQGTILSKHVDTHGTPDWLILNWNTGLLYPEEVPVDELLVEAELLMPSGWQFGTSLKTASQTETSVRFEPVTYEVLLDSPLIAGRHFRTIDLYPGQEPPHYLHVVADDEEHLRAPQETIDRLRNLPAQGMAAFGRAHFDSYHFLLVLTDVESYHIGLEHRRSSLNTWSANGLTDPGQLPGLGHLLAHEYAHSWCGKYHRPAGMARDDYHTPKDTRLLWVYEGLDTYLGQVLAARSLLMARTEDQSINEARKSLGRSVRWHMSQRGGGSINLEDTASSNFLRRAGSEHWNRLVRAQDYYFVGMMLWLEIDAIIRDETADRVAAEQKTLDDFLQRFLGRHEEGVEKIGFTEADVIDALNQVVPYDWAGLIEERVRGWNEHLPLAFLDRMGYRVQYSNQPTDYDSSMVDTSLGMRVNGSGHVSHVIPGEVASQVGFSDQAKIVGVNGHTFSTERLHDAVENSVHQRSIDLLVLFGDVFREVEIPYAEGPKYFDMERNDKPDLIEQIYAPLETDS